MSPKQLDIKYIMPIPIIVHTHSEYSFIWKAAIPLLEKYAKDYEIIWCCDSLLDFTLPVGWRTYNYDPLMNWGSRIKGCLETIQSDYVIYIQEDCLLIDHILKDRIEHCLNFMKFKQCEFLMSYPWNNREGNIASTVYENCNFIKIFSHYMQPGIWKKSLLYEISCLNVKASENESEICFNITKDRNCYGVFHISDMRLFNSDYRQLSMRSFFFPHMHAIAGGKWTFTQYPSLKALVEAYGIDTTTRGVDTKWISEFQ
jgi:hypothetical protein